MNREQEKEQLEQKIAQAEQKERRYAIEQRILYREQAQLERKRRNHRIFTRGAMLESFLKKPLLLTDGQIYELLKTAFRHQDVQSREIELLKQVLPKIYAEYPEEGTLSE
ncbi:MAG: DUF3847 domain-containing protein [Anaerolineaceae bacterium]|nr:DUF3847 domain-containing protein [Anaerolineaceae bacterium]